MDIILKDIPYIVDNLNLEQRLVDIFHTPRFKYYGFPISFKLHLFQDKYRHHPHSGSGILTLQSKEIGQALLQVCASGIDLNGQFICLKQSEQQPLSKVVEEIQRLPYCNPLAIGEKKERPDLSGQVVLRSVQFAWLCRDQKLSIEWQWNDEDIILSPVPNYCLYFHGETRQFIVKRSSDSTVTSISMRYSRILAVETDRRAKSISLWLETPPSFEEEATREALVAGSNKKPCRKLQYLNATHKPMAPFTSNLLRLVCQSDTGLADFKRMAKLANLRVTDHIRSLERRYLFSEDKQKRLEEWLCKLDWGVAFQCEALRRNRLLETDELLKLSLRINELIRGRGLEHAAKVIRQFGLCIKGLWSEEEKQKQVVDSCFTMAMEVIDQNGTHLDTNPRLVQCFHVTFTPTTMNLRGPFPDTSNRILRQYKKNQDAFLRVSFADEENYKFKYDRRKVDGSRFIRDHVGTILKKGFQLCGRHFEFLAYSQSALKQHSVWFVTRFKDSNGLWVNAESIRKTIGSAWPKELLQCPARYAARLSQAFTATESSVIIESDQIRRIPDIERNGFCFSDGNAPCSQSMADAIHGALGRGTERAPTPSVFQVRILGAKGVLSVDPTLDGLDGLDSFVLCLRPSMEKFKSTITPEVEIARSFNRPMKFFLNRPLVMILEHLGVKADTFLKLQRNAVKETNEASKSLKGAAGLLEKHGLGSAFALQSTFSNLQQLGIDFERNVTQSGLLDPFMDCCMKFAVHHVLREIKFKARIPVPECWKLVGVVDEHNILKPNQIYACIKRGENVEYLEGRIALSKSPTIHPGDIQIAEAIGQPPSDSHLRALANCVVFSQQGDRPLPNKLSGSDLDGDEYDLIKLAELIPPLTVEPGSYPPAKRKTLNRDSTIDDVADFVVDYINNDMLGLVATNFLLISDQHPDNIFAEDCAELAKLHSWAVDFPKNGQPVPNNIIPYPADRRKPDWFTPEVTDNLNTDTYKSNTALGKMYREIDLSSLRDSVDSGAQQRRRNERQPKGLSQEDTLARFSLASNGLNDPISTKLLPRLKRLVDLVDTKKLTIAMSDLFDHYATELEYICYSYTLSRSTKSRLTEEEVFMSTIIAKSADHRRRTESILTMRDETSSLVRCMLKEFKGGKKYVCKDWANRAWTAWRISLMKKDIFGAKSFGWMALRSIFEVIKELDT